MARYNPRRSQNDPAAEEPLPLGKRNTARSLRPCLRSLRRPVSVGRSARRRAALHFGIRFSSHRTRDGARAPAADSSQSGGAALLRPATPCRQFRRNWRVFIISSDGSAVRRASTRFYGLGADGGPNERGAGRGAGRAPRRREGRRRLAAGRLAGRERAHRTRRQTPGPEALADTGLRRHTRTSLALPLAGARKHVTRSLWVCGTAWLEDARRGTRSSRSALN